MKRRPMTLVLLAALGAAGTAAAAEGDGLQACAAIGESTARLACYDRLAQRVEAPPAPTPAAEFGVDSMAPAQRPPAEQHENEKLSARLAQPFKGWERGTLFELDNGQVWKATGDESAYYGHAAPGLAVTIEKSWFGGYRMKIEKYGRTIKVRRVK